MRWVHALAAAAAIAFVAVPAGASDYPARTITMVVPFSAGGPTDVLARIFGQHMSQTLGQQIIIENITGAGGSIGAARVAKADPDGYTMVMGNLGTHAAAVGLYKNLSYDPRTDFEPVILAASTPMVLVTKKKLGVKTLQEFIALAKTRRLTLGSAGVGSISHLTYLLFTKLTGLDIQHVPYRGLSQVANDLLSGQIDFTFDQVISATPHIMSGEVKPIVLCQSTRTPNLPDVPSSTEAGLPGLQTTAWSALFLPKGTPKAIVDRINAAAIAAMEDGSVARRLADLSAEAPPPAERTPQALGKLVSDEINKWVPLIQAAEKAPAK